MAQDRREPHHDPTRHTKTWTPTRQLGCTIHKTVVSRQTTSTTLWIAHDSRSFPNSPRVKFAAPSRDLPAILLLPIMGLELVERMDMRMAMLNWNPVRSLGGWLVQRRSSRAVSRSNIDQTKRPHLVHGPCDQVRKVPECQAHRRRGLVRKLQHRQWRSGISENNRGFTRYRGSREQHFPAEEARQEGASP
jgi:hypothetical protein